MKDKSESLNWIHKKPEFKQYEELFTLKEWKAMANAGFEAFCDGKNYSIEIGLGYLIAMHHVKKEIHKLASQQILPYVKFSEIAQLTWNKLLESLKQNLTSNVSVVFQWLGQTLTQTMQTTGLDYQTGSQIADLLVDDSVRLMLEKLDEQYCVKKEFIGQDARELLLKKLISFKEFLRIGQKIQQDLAKRTMPNWIKSDPELFRIALHFNALQLEVLEVCRFDKIAAEKSVTILRTVILRMVENQAYQIDRRLFKELVMEVYQQQEELRNQSAFKSNVVEFLNHSNLLIEETVNQNVLSNEEILQNQLFDECKKEEPNEETILSLFKQGVNFKLKDSNDKTALDYICEQKFPSFDCIAFFIGAGCPISIVIPHTEKLVAQSIQQNRGHALVLILLMTSVQEKKIAEKIKLFANNQGTLIERFIALFVAADLFNQLKIINTISNLSEEDMDGDKIMIALLNLQNQVGNTLPLEVIRDEEEDDSSSEDNQGQFIELSLKDGNEDEEKQDIEDKPQQNKNETSSLVSHSFYPPSVDNNKYSGKKKEEDKGCIMF